MVKHKSIMVVSLAFSVILYIIMSCVLYFEFDIHTSPFFHANVNSNDTTNNPQILGVKVENKAQMVGLCLFFAMNALLGVLNSILIDGLWGMMLFEEGEVVIHDIIAQYPNVFVTFAIYDMWKTTRIFFSLLGLYSNIVFFASTAIGSLAAGLITKWIYISPKYRHLLRPNLKNCNNKKDGDDAHWVSGSRLATSLFLLPRK
jgi:hypothetical protein